MYVFVLLIGMGGAVGSDEFLWVTASSMRYGAPPHQEPLDLRPQGSESPLDAGPWVHHAGLALNRRNADYADAHLHPCHPAHHQVHQKLYHPTTYPLIIYLLSHETDIF